MRAESQSYFGDFDSPGYICWDSVIWEYYLFFPFPFFVGGGGVVDPALEPRWAGDNH